MGDGQGLRPKKLVTNGYQPSTARILSGVESGVPGTWVPGTWGLGGPGDWGVPGTRGLGSRGLCT